MRKPGEKFARLRKMVLRLQTKMGRAKPSESVTRFHATLKKNIPSIRKHGLIPSTELWKKDIVNRHDLTNAGQQSVFVAKRKQMKPWIEGLFRGGTAITKVRVPKKDIARETLYESWLKRGKSLQRGNVRVMRKRGKV